MPETLYDKRPCKIIDNLMLSCYLIRVLITQIPIYDLKNGYRLRYLLTRTLASV